MGRLVLTRKAGESVYVGELLVTVTRVTRANANLMTAKPRAVHNCAIGDMLILEPGVSITVKAIARGIVRLVFDVPREINIVRQELIENEQPS